MVGNRTISKNPKAFFEYAMEGQGYTAGLVLEGWEVKSLREGRASIKESYITSKGDEFWLIGCHISPLDTTMKSYQFKPDPTRNRKLLLNRNEISKLKKATTREGYTLAPLELHWDKKNRYVKLKFKLAKGQKRHDKRRNIKERDVEREMQRQRKNA